MTWVNQTRNLSHETKITAYKENKNKLKILIFNQWNVEGEIEIQLKEGQKKPS
jgi:hypothetical protein